MSAIKEDRAEHTPGPWKYHEELGAQFSMIGNTDYVVAGIPNETWTGDERDLPIQRANASLISAAPDLLKAAQESADALNEIAEEFGYHNVIMDAISRLQAATSKATGK